MKAPRHKHEPQHIGYEDRLGGLDNGPIYWCPKCGAVKRRWYGRWCIRNNTASWRKSLFVR